MINECNILYNENDFPVLNVLRSYKDIPQNDTSTLSQLKYLDSKTQIKDLAYEQIYVLSHNINGNLKGFMCVGSGDYDHCDVFFRNIGMFILLSGAEKATLIHNHPENVREQTEEDVEFTNKFCSICNMFNIVYNGSYILCHDGCVQIPIEAFYDWRLIK